MAPCCTHGVTPSSPSAENKKRLLKGCARTMRKVDDEFGDYGRDVVLKERLRAFYGFWLDPNRSPLVDKELSAMYFAAATDNLLQGGPGSETKARLMSTFAINIREVAEQGGAAFTHEMNRNGPSKEMAQAMLKFRTRDGLVRFLAATIPCSCLDEQNDRATAGPEMGKCFFCSKANEKIKLYKCSRCRLVEYCSKECQIADWRQRHKSCCHKLENVMQKS